MVAQFRQRDADTPVLLMGYANPIERMGYGEFVDAASAAGLDAVLTVDMPPEEVGAFNRHLQQAEMDNIFLIAPTTPAERRQTIVDSASGFIYYVSLKGVTGAGHLDTEAVASGVASIRALSPLPVAVGFGIKDAASAAAVAAVADGVVVGSALVQLLADTYAASASAEDARTAAVELVSSMRRAIDATAGSGDG